jgi:hypothetical protein
MTRHYISRNHANRIPSIHVAVDTETVPVPLPNNPAVHVHRLMLGVARAWRYEAGKVTRERELVFRRPENFWAWLNEVADQRRSCWVWAHSLGFDLTAMQIWKELESYRLVFESSRMRGDNEEGEERKGRTWRGFFVSEDPPTIMLVKNRAGATIRFLDTMNFFPSKLSELGQAVSLDKLPQPGELGTDEDWTTYCRRDCEIVQRVVCQIVDWVTRWDLGNLRSTLASQAFAAWRHGRMDCPVVFSGDRAVQANERKAYWGGRRILKFRGAIVPEGLGGLASMTGIDPALPVLEAGPVYQLDVRSCYPAVMHSEEFPVAFRGFRKSPPVDRVRQWMASYGVLAQVLISSTNHVYPRRLEDRVSWCRGKFLTWLCGPELELAIKRKEVKEVDWCQLYTMGRPFRTFVELAWKMRDAHKQAGQPLLDAASKNMANALHGRFAIRSGGWRIVPGMAPVPPWGTKPRLDVDSGAYRLFRGIGCAMQIRDPASEPEEGFPAIAAWVTAYARQRIDAAALVAGRKAVLYEDADSLHVTAEGYRRLERDGWISEDQPGKLHVEHKGDVAVYLAPRFYRLGDKTVRAGLHSNAWQDAQGLWHQVNFRRLDTLLLTEPASGPVCDDLMATSQPPPIDGVVGEDGWITPAYTLG